MNLVKVCETMRTFHYKHYNHDIHKMQSGEPLVIRFLSGRLFEYTVSPTDTVLSLKETIRKDQSLGRNTLKNIVCKDNILYDSQTFQYYEIQNGDTIEEVESCVFCHMTEDPDQRCWDSNAGYETRYLYYKAYPDKKKCRSCIKYMSPLACIYCSDNRDTHGISLGSGITASACDECYPN